MLAAGQVRGAIRIVAGRLRHGTNPSAFHVDIGMTEPPRSATAMSGVQGLLALQETSSESLDRAALTNAEMLLDALGALQAGRVGDASTGSAASRIERLLGEATPPADPRLGELLRQVALRARIELWRQRSTQSA